MRSCCALSLSDDARLYFATATAASVAEACPKCLTSLTCVPNVRRVNNLCLGRHMFFRCRFWEGGSSQTTHWILEPSAQESWSGPFNVGIWLGVNLILICEATRQLRMTRTACCIFIILRLYNICVLHDSSLVFRNAMARVDKRSNDR